MNQFPGTNYHDLNLNWLLGQMKNCLAEWETTKGQWTALAADNAEFKAYVTNYFDNLDVTQEISDKIDALVEDGTLLRILTEDEGEGSPLSDTVGEWLAAHITQETGYVIDDTLTVQGAAADAKAAGDAIADLKGAINADENGIVYDGIIKFQNSLLEWEHGNINANYEDANSNRNDFARTKGYFHTEKPTQITIVKQSPTSAIVVCVYSKSGDVYTGESRTVYNANVVMTLNIEKYYRFCVTATSTSDVININDISPYALFNMPILQTIGGVKNIGQTQSKLGNSGISIASNSTVAANTKLEITTFPKFIKQRHSFAIHVSFASFVSLIVGQGYNQDRGRWLEIDTTNVYVKDSERTIGTIAHNISFTGAIEIFATLDILNNEKALFNMVTNTGSFTYLFNYSNEVTGNYFFIAGMNIGKYNFTAISNALLSPLWIFGDSYMSVYVNRVAGQLKEFGYFDNIMIDAYPGNDSEDAYADLLKCLELATPKFIVWATGMNDTSAQYQAVYANLNAICVEKNIELILYRIPTVTARYSDNQAVNTFMLSTGKRYVNAYSAVESVNIGEWYSGLLDVDGVHPTEQGAKVIAGRFLIDVPEIVQY